MKEKQMEKKRMEVWVVVYIWSCVEMYLKVFRRKKDAQKVYNEFKKKYNRDKDFLDSYKVEVE